MNAKKYFEKYYLKLKLEALLKSTLCGLCVGFTACFIASFATWFTDFDGLWLSIGILAAVTAAVAPIFYFKLFKLTAMSNAKRIDRLGLEERLITMIEYEDDDSFIAKAQRADARAKLAEVEASQVKFTVPAKIIIAVAIAATVASAMVTVSSLGTAGLIPDGNELLEAIIPDEPDVYISISYVVEDGGYIDGEEEQLVILGGIGEPVLAVADDGYKFAGWDDGGRKPSRTDRGVSENVIYTAMFIPLGDQGEGDGEGDQEGDEPGDQPGEGKPGKDGKPSPDGQDDSNGELGGGKYEDCNQVIDGETYYREVKNSYRDTLLEQMESDGSLTPELKEIIESYIDIV